MELNPYQTHDAWSTWGWRILIGMSALLILAGAGWTFSLPEMALKNIAEYANLDVAVLMQSSPSASDIITLIARGYGFGYTILGLMSLIISLEGYRTRVRWARVALWMLAAAYAGLALSFMQAGESSILSLGIFVFAGATVAGLLLAGRSRVA